jgi:hypothetical protein
MRCTKLAVTEKRLVWAPREPLMRSRTSNSEMSKPAIERATKNLTSDRRRRANLANAKASTGPRTEAGKARSSQNAFRHGLNVSIWSDSALASQAEEVTLRIAGPNADAGTMARARAIAEAQFLLSRVRTRRLKLLQEPWRPSLSINEKQLHVIEAIGQLELDEFPAFKVLRPIEGDEKLTKVLDDRKDEFVRLDQYERRALSRRKSAIRNFDAR